MVWLGLAGIAGLADEGLEVVGSGFGAVDAAGGGLGGVPLALPENDGFDATVGFEVTDVGFEATVGFVAIIGFEATVGFED